MAERSSWIPQGPREQDLLWFQPQHRSRHIYSSHEECDRPLLVRRADTFFWEWYMEYDHHLLTALAERWRPETHSFHLSIGETTITLQDVEVLMGLRVDGLPVTGSESYPSDIDGYVERMFGCRPRRYGKTAIRLACIREHLEDNREHSQNKIDLFILRLLEDPEACGCLSWGSAMLAYTYLALCNSASSGEHYMNMCGLLVQSWAWTRILKVRPRFRRGHVAPVDVPFAAQWTRPLSRTNITSHILVAYRDQLSIMTSSRFLWTPYADLMYSLPDDCHQDEHIWMLRTYLYYYYIMDGHYPNRVMRQFGCLQVVPDAPLNENETNRLHRLKRSSHVMNWQQVHNVYVHEWHTQAKRVVEGTPTAHPEAQPPYRIWYSNKTVRFVQDPSHEPATGGYHGHTDLIECPERRVEPPNVVGEQPSGEYRDNQYH
ncbi:serine/threonine-protein phosphatase 7 long form homolog [Rutidosis leptorrhynchoides]|uniref:serine/threonine-protein phosphatase 7 long form homolog n=1 Tax=Rutidosis leptorrhynchoides TaxID=125765 RepID=UPI003A99A6EB